VIVKTIAGFLNSKGGALLVGVTDDGDIVGLEQDFATLNKRPDRDGYQQFLTTLLSNGIGKVPTSASLSISFHALASKEVCLVQVTRSSEPVYVSDGGAKRFYVRTQNTTQDLDVEQAAAYAKTAWPK
jgi:predicted HTH transcriptional regulator